MSTEKKEEQTKKPIRKFAPMKQITMTKTYSEKITIREFKGCNVNGAAIIEAFAQQEQMDISQMAAEYIIQQLDLPLIGDIISESFPPLTIVKDGIPSHSGRIYGNKDIVVFISDYKFGPELSNLFVKVLYDFAQRHQSSILITMKAFDMKDKIDLQPEEQPQSKEDILKMIQKSKEKKDENLWFITNNEEFSNKMVKLNHKPLQDTVVSGISGGILAESSYTNIPVACLFSPIQDLYKLIPVDARAAVQLLKCVNFLLDGKINLEKASKDAEKIEEKMIEVLENIQTPQSTKKDLGQMWL